MLSVVSIIVDIIGCAMYVLWNIKCLGIPLLIWEALLLVLQVVVFTVVRPPVQMPPLREYPEEVNPNRIGKYNHGGW